MTAAGSRLLPQLARLYDVQTAYYDVSHHRRQASPEALLALLPALGAPVAHLRDVPAALRARRQESWRRLLEPAAVAWEGDLPYLEARLPADGNNIRVAARLQRADGEENRWEWARDALPVTARAEVEGRPYLLCRLPLNLKLPHGYHRFTLESAGGQAETMLISAPLQAYQGPPGGKAGWGVFLPLYALRAEDDWGSGNFTHLAALMDRVAELGGSTVATLPLLPMPLGKEATFSPYNPVSRLFWNEFYLDVTAVPEINTPPAAAILRSAPFRKEITVLGRMPLVDYPRGMALKRRVLAEMCRAFFTASSERREEFERFAAEHPQLTDYACFRAAGERQGKPWRSWPSRLREGTLREGDYREEDRRYHEYVQWLSHRQMSAAADNAQKRGCELYLDLPVGVHPDGYDAWRERSAFITGASAGAPPDAVFTRGQDWMFCPLHPRKIREQGYRYVISYLRHHMAHAGVLRIDHVMGLHRLFCIPPGMAARDGVYLRYPAEELYAILCLESHRHGTALIGEDLGTVPPYVRPMMRRHGFRRMYVLHYELAGSLGKTMPSPARDCAASLNTHDMPPFAAFWRGQDIPARQELGLLDEAGAAAEKQNLRRMKRALTAFLRRRGWLKEPGTGVPAVFRACLSFLAAGRARLVLVNLEDLWQETRFQNVPSTVTEYPNWRRKARYRLEELCHLPPLLATLSLVDRLRKARGEEK
ncbi:MAG: 4-alpha-glucanotransferase [Chloroflexota bacterium]